MGAIPVRTAAFAALLLVAGCTSAGRDPFVSVGSGGLPETGEALYDAVCAGCHGLDGTGAPRALLGFEEPVPDFTECTFATREPDADWIAVAHQGGPVRGFSHRMPSFGEALTEGQFRRVLAHIRTFCADDRWPRGELNFPRALVTEKAFPEDEVILEGAADLEDGRSITAQFVYEKRFGPASMVEVVAPFGWTESEGGWTGGHLGDLGIGVKHVLAKSQRARRILSIGGEMILPTGDEEFGLGKGVTIFEPFLSFGQALPFHAFVQAQAGAEVPLNQEDFENEAFCRAGFGKTVTEGPWGRAWSPMVEIVGRRDLESGAFMHWHAVPQVQVTLNRRQHIMANIGVRLPLDGSGDDPQWMFYLLWEWFDGGLRDGW